MARTARADERVANDDRKSAIVATVSRKRAKLPCAERTVEHDRDPEATAQVNPALGPVSDALADRRIGSRRLTGVVGLAVLRSRLGAYRGKVDAQLVERFGGRRSCS